MSGLFAKGASLWKGNAASPEVFSKIGKVKSITGPGFSVKFVDGTTHDTTSNFDEPVAVQCSAGDITFAVNYDPADPTLAPATGLYEQMQALARGHFQMRFPASDSLHTRMNFTAFVASHPMAFPVDNLIEATIALKIDGAIVWDTFTP
jgi:hypothetical protein